MAKDQPTFDELVVALKSLERPDSALSRHVSTIVVTCVIAIGAWTLTTLNSVQVTLSGIQSAVETSAKTVEETRSTILTVASQQNDMKVEQAELKQRVETLERYHGK